MASEKEISKTDKVEIDNQQTTIQETKKIKKKAITQVIYNGIQYDVLEQIQDEVLIEITTENYLSGKMIKVKQWVKLEAVQRVE